MNIYYREIIFSTSSGLTFDQLTSIMRGLTHTLPAVPANPNPEETQEQRGLKYADNHGSLPLSFC
jgi:hypothetical protein